MQEEKGKKNVLCEHQSDKTLVAKMRIYGRAKDKVNMMEKSQVFSTCADNFVLRIRTVWRSFLIYIDYWIVLVY